MKFVKQLHIMWDNPKKHKLYLLDSCICKKISNFSDFLKYKRQTLTNL